MSYSSPFAFIEMGSDGAPIIDATQFRTIIDHYGWNVRRRRISMTKDCPCFDPIGNVANPDCAFCEGTGNLSGYLDEVMRGLLLFNVPNGYWGLADMNTIAGMLERTECAGFFPPEADVQIDDLIILITSSVVDPVEEWHELRVYNKMPRLVGDRLGNYIHIYTRADMRHVEYSTSEDFP